MVVADEGGGYSDLTVDDFVMKSILEHPRAKGEVSSSDVRDWLRNKLVHRGVRNVAEVINGSLEQLLVDGLVKTVARHSKD